MGHSLLLLIAVVLLVIAAIDDWRTMLIPNRLSYGMLAGGLILQAVFFGSTGLLQGLSGAVIAGLPLLVLWLLGGVAAGDVKLMAATGAFLGVKLSLVALAATMILGGLLAALAMLRARLAGQETRGLRMAYAPAIAMGGVVAACVGVVG